MNRAVEESYQETPQHKALSFEEPNFILVTGQQARFKFSLISVFAPI